MNGADSAEARPPRIQVGELEHGAIGFREALSVGLASTAPAYSLAAVIGSMVVIAGFGMGFLILGPARRVEAARGGDVLRMWALREGRSRRAGRILS